MRRYPSNRAKIEVKEVTKQYSSSQPLAVDNVNFEIGESQILGLLGPNGAGKSSLFNMITLSLRPTSGLIALDS
jgi:branched-chain amino acid transport system ATP-binding protein